MRDCVFSLVTLAAAPRGSRKACREGRTASYPSGRRRGEGREDASAMRETRRRLDQSAIRSERDRGEGTWRGEGRRGERAVSLRSQRSGQHATLSQPLRHARARAARRRSPPRACRTRRGALAALRAARHGEGREDVVSERSRCHNSLTARWTVATPRRGTLRTPRTRRGTHAPRAPHAPRTSRASERAPVARLA